MTDLDYLKEIEETLGFKLNKVPFDKLETEKSFFPYILWSIFMPFFLTKEEKQNYIIHNKATRNYSIDESDNITGLSLDYSALHLFSSSFFSKFKHLKKLKIKGSYLPNLSFLKELKNLSSLDLEDNPITGPDKDIIATRSCKNKGIS